MATKHPAVSLRAEHLARLPLFPLPRVVFFPHTMLPLHVFEPRYQALIAWCIENDWPLAVPLIEPGREDEAEGNPPIVPVAGVGTIGEHQALGGGRYNIILQGVARVRLDEELDPGLPYRLGRYTMLSDDGGDGGDAVDRRVRTTFACLDELKLRIPPLAKVLDGPLLQVTDPAVLSDRLSAVLFHDYKLRQGQLECLDVIERFDRIVARLGGLLAGTLDDEDPIH